MNIELTRISSKGQVVIPNEVREQMDIIIREKGLRSEFKFEDNLPIISLDKGKIVKDTHPSKPSTVGKGKSKILDQKSGKKKK